MNGPQVVVELSTEFLSTLIHNTVGDQMNCPLDPDLFTDVVINEVAPLRGDEKDVGFYDAQGLFDTLGADFGFSKNQTLKINLGGENATIQVPATFLLVSGQLRPFTDQFLHDNGSSDKAPTQVFSRPESSLLFSLTPQVVGDSLNLHLEFQTVFAPLNQQMKEQVKELRNKFPPIDRPLPLTSVLGVLGGGGTVINAGATADPWASGKEPGHGLRVAFDVAYPDDAAGWTAFFNSPPQWDLTVHREEWSIFASGDFFAVLTEKLIGKALAGITAVKAWIDQPVVTLQGMSVLVRATVHADAVVAALGDVVITLTPRLDAGQDPTATYVVLNICMKFADDIGGDIATWFLSVGLGAIAGGVIFGPWGLLVGAIVGALAGIAVDVGIRVEGDHAQEAFANADLKMDCGEVDQNNCRDCKIVMYDYVTGLGWLKLTRLAPAAGGYLMAGGVLGGLEMEEPAHLDITLTDWGYPWAACDAPDSDPSRSLLVRNTGGLPLKVCGLGPHITADGPVDALKIYPGAVKPNFATPLDLSDPILVDPNLAFGVTIKAKIRGNGAYDENNPPKLFLRIITNAGALELDLNQPTAAKSEEPQRNLQDSMQSGLLCIGLGTPVKPDLWSQMAFTDPVPFTTVQRVQERIDVDVTGFADGLLVQAAGTDGRVLGQAQVLQGAAHFTATIAHPPSVNHENSQLNIGLHAPGSFAPAAAGASGTTASAHMHAVSSGGCGFPHWSLSRTLYVQGAWSLFDSAIIDAVRAGNKHIVVLTGNEIRVGVVSGRRIRLAALASVKDPHALIAFHNRCVLATSDGMFAFDLTLRPLWRNDVLVECLCAWKDKLWCSTGTKIISLEEDGCVIEQFAIEMPRVKHLVCAGGTLLALADQSAWDLGMTPPRNLEIRAERLHVLADSPAAELGGRLVVFDRDGRITAQYNGLPWFASIINFPQAAVEVRRPQGILVLYDRYATAVDVNRLPTRFPLSGIQAQGGL